MSLLARLKQPAAEDGWRRFVDLYTPLLFHWVRGLGVRGADTADVVQEVFTVLVQKLPEFNYDRNGSFRAWLRTVTQNKCHDRLRKIVASNAAEVTLDVVEPEQQGEAERFAEEEYCTVLAQKGLQLMQNEFDTNTWKACWESVACGRSAADVGRELDMSLNAVYLAKSRVLRRLREELDGLLD